MKHLVAGLAMIAATTLTCGHAQAQTSRQIFVSNSCAHPVRLYVKWKDPKRGPWMAGPWTFAANSAASPLREVPEGSVFHDDAEQIYIYGETTDGSSTYWQGNTNVVWKGVTYRLTTPTVTLTEGHLLIDLTCPSASTAAPVSSLSYAEQSRRLAEALSAIPRSQPRPVPYVPPPAPAAITTNRLPGSGWTIVTDHESFCAAYGPSEQLGVGIVWERAMGTMLMVYGDGVRFDNSPGATDIKTERITAQYDDSGTGYLNTAFFDAQVRLRRAPGFKSLVYAIGSNYDRPVELRPALRRIQFEIGDKSFDRRFEMGWPLVWVERCRAGMAGRK